MKKTQYAIYVDMIVEIPNNSNVKYEYDKVCKRMRCDRIISTSMLYPGNYGYIPKTLSGDGDPVDILLICDYAIYPGTIVNAKIIGILLTEDEKGGDEKVIAVPAEEVDQSSFYINDYQDLGPQMLVKIKHFFKHYKDNESNKWVKVGDYKSIIETKTILETARKRFLQKI